jgi:hypothetical protein
MQRTGEDGEERVLVKLVGLKEAAAKGPAHAFRPSRAVEVREAPRHVLRASHTHTVPLALGRWITWSIQAGVASATRMQTNATKPTTCAVSPTQLT